MQLSSGQQFQQFQNIEKFIREFVDLKLDSFVYDRIYNSAKFEALLV